MTRSSATVSNSPGMHAPALPALLAGVALAIGACSGRAGYDTALPPPAGHEPVARALPMRIGGEVRRIEPLAAADGVVRGVRARYGTQATVELLRAEVPALRLAWFQAAVAPRLARMGGDGTGAAAGRWQAMAPDGGRLLAWRNQDWLFLIEARDGRLLDEVVDRLPWVAQRGQARRRAAAMPPDEVPAAPRSTTASGVPR